MINIVLYGAPGCGKGTQAKMLCDGLDLYHMNAGSLLREEIERGSELAEEISSIIDNGHLVPDEMITKLVKNEYIRIYKTHDNIKGVLFDGYPRSNQQAKDLDSILSTYDENINNCFHLEIDDSVIFDRLKKRADEEGRVDDQDQQKIQNRIDHYNEEKNGVLMYYKNQMKLDTIDGDKDKIVVLKSILDNISK